MDLRSSAAGTEPVTWLPVHDYAGMYEVSDRGQAQSLDRIVGYVSRWGTLAQRQLRGCVLKPSLVGEYLCVGLRRDGQHETRPVHRLVLEEFAGPCPSGMEALHGPGGKQDNRWPENLCWGTFFQNALDKYRDGTINIGNRNGSAKLT